MKLKCNHCGKEIQRRNRHGKRHKNFYCNKQCSYAAKEKKFLVSCDWCKTEFKKKRNDVARTNHNLCSRGCYLDFINFFQAGAFNQMVCGQILYRGLVEMQIGRSLNSSEEIHHIDGNHNNNQRSNLMIVSKSEHALIHAASRKRDKYGRFIKRS